MSKSSSAIELIIYAGEIAQILVEFLEVAITSIVFLKGIYPSGAILSLICLRSYFLLYFWESMVIAWCFFHFISIKLLIKLGFWSLPLPNRRE